MSAPREAPAVRPAPGNGGPPNPPARARAWREAVGQLRPFLPLVVLAICLFVVAILFESLALIMLGPLLDFATSGGLGLETEGRLFDLVFGAMARVGLPADGVGVALLVIGCLVGKSAATITGDFLRARIVAEYERRTRNALARGLLHARWESVMGERSGDFLSVMTLQVDRAARGFVIHLLLFIGQLVMALTYVAVAVAVMPVAGVGVGLLMLAVGLMLSRVFRSIRGWSTEFVSVFGNLTQRLSEAAGGLKVLKALGAEGGATAAIQSDTDLLYRLRIRIDLLRSGFSASLEPALILALLAMLAMMSAGVTNVVTVGLVGILLLRAFQRVFAASSSVTAIVESLPSVAVVADALERLEGDVERSSGEQLATFDRLELRDVAYRYPNGQPGVEALNTSIEPGEFVGIVGASGAGKSTFLDLVLGLLEPTSGAVVVNGRSLEGISLQAWRRRIGYVPQDVLLFNDSILANVTLGRPDCSEAEVLEALRIAQIAQVVEERAGGVHTDVGERGFGFSGGERQRLALARAIVGHPEILVFDEATSSLDGPSERAFHESLEAMRGKFTMIVVAHRLSTVLGADRILVMERGRLVESGRPSDLLADPASRFSRLRGSDGSPAPEDPLLPMEGEVRRSTLPDLGTGT